LSDDDFFNTKINLNNELKAIQEKIDDLSARTQNWMNLAIDTFNFARYAKHHYEHGDITTKKSILLGLSSNLLIKDKKVMISLPKHLELINTTNNQIKELGIKFEPAFLGSDNKKTSPLEPVFSSMLRDLDSNQDKWLQRPWSYR
jgi:hypothetical protein